MDIDLNFGSIPRFIFTKLCYDNFHEKLQGFKFIAFTIFVKFLKGQQGRNLSRVQMIFSQNSKCYFVCEESFGHIFYSRGQNI